MAVTRGDNEEARRAGRAAPRSPRGTKAQEVPDNSAMEQYARSRRAPNAAPSTIREGTTRVPEAVVQQVMDMGMENALALARSGDADPQFHEVVRRFYGDTGTQASRAGTPVQSRVPDPSSPLAEVGQNVRSFQDREELETNPAVGPPQGPPSADAPELGPMPQQPRPQFITGGTGEGPLNQQVADLLGGNHPDFQSPGDFAAATVDPLLDAGAAVGNDLGVIGRQIPQGLSAIGRGLGNVGNAVSASAADAYQDTYAEPKTNTGGTIPRDMQPPADPASPAPPGSPEPGPNGIPSPHPLLAFMQAQQPQGGGSTEPLPQGPPSAQSQSGSPNPNPAVGASQEDLLRIITSILSNANGNPYTPQ